MTWWVRSCGLRQSASSGEPWPEEIMMSFIWPGMLYLLILVPLLAAAYLYREIRRRRRAVHLGTLGFLQAGSGRRPAVRLYVPSALFLASVSAMTLAIARPQYTVSLPRLEGTVVLV